MTIRDKEFEPYIFEEQILTRIREISRDVNKSYAEKNPLFVSVLNGSFMFAADLMKEISIRSEISFVKFSSYQNMDSTGEIKELIGLNDEVKGRDIIIIEDIVDTGHTMHHLLGDIEKFKPASVAICTLLFKPDALKRDIDLEYVGFSIPNKFVVGYGLDYDGYGRNLRDIYQLSESSS
ncbi:hypoxanthine phosphoribosyltransferase [Roseivirga sp. BDSF3-8]|uniref:hypoxanthine phosphoribosyltransferase n=1 Tax=Roseivirga sp. BDSF3-8 TaxID=3241598 RepID=UPI003531DC06